MVNKKRLKKQFKSSVPIGDYEIHHIESSEGLLILFKIGSNFVTLEEASSVHLDDEEYWETKLTPYFLVALNDSEGYPAGEISEVIKDSRKEVKRFTTLEEAEEFTKEYFVMTLDEVLVYIEDTVFSVTLNSHIDECRQDKLFTCKPTKANKSGKIFKSEKEALKYIQLMSLKQTEVWKNFPELCLFVVTGLDTDLCNIVGMSSNQFILKSRNTGKISLSEVFYFI